MLLSEPMSTSQVLHERAIVTHLVAVGEQTVRLGGAEVEEAGSERSYAGE